MEMQDKLFRSCTLANNVQVLLLKYIKENDYEQLEDLLAEGRVNINYVYKDCEEFIYEDKNVLQIACLYLANETSEKCIQLLLDHGAHIFYKDPDTGKTAVHFAAEGGNYKILETLLNFKNKKINNECNNIIFTLIKYIRDAEEKEEKYIKILEMLLTTDIDINYQDLQSGWTAIYMAAKYKFKYFIKTLIGHHEIDLDIYQDKLGKTARDLIKELKLYDGELPEYREENSNVSIHTLFKNLSRREFDEFSTNYTNIHSTIKPDEKEELFKRCLQLNDPEPIIFLLNNLSNYDLNRATDKTYSDNPLVETSAQGKFKIVKLILDRELKPEIVSAAIFKILKSPYISKKTDDVNYERCLHFLIRYKHLNINAEDWNKNTALHYALRYHNPEISLEILRNGGSLAAKDSFNNLAVSDIDSSTFKTHLNECIRYDNEEISSYEDACLIINLTSLVPPRQNKVDNSNTSLNIENKVGSEQIPGINEQFGAETEVLQYMCTSPELKEFLKHPVILAFLYMKWHKIRMFFYINLAIYMLFILSLLTYITIGYNSVSKLEHKFFTTLSYILLTITFTILVVREIFQIIIYKHRYFLTFENWLEITLLIVTGGILIEQTNETQTRQLSAIAIVAAAIEFLLLVGQFPAMSTNIMMLRTVSYTFFKLLLWYSILLIAFAYSFYTLFQDSSNSSIPNNSTKSAIETESENDDEEQDFFENPGMSLLKTIVMLTGEFDAASIKFNTYPIISQLIFVMFVFLIAIVLFNLLNGLAVSDTQTIKNDAELYGHILRIEHIAHVEKVLLTNKLIHYIPRIKKICLFPWNVKKMEILVYPNQNSKVELIQTLDDYDEHERKPSCFKVFFGVYLEMKIQKAINELLKKLREESRMKKEHEKYDEIIAMLKQLLEKRKN